MLKSILKDIIENYCISFTKFVFVGVAGNSYLEWYYNNRCSSFA
jgi:hypothetical protein